MTKEAIRIMQEVRNLSYDDWEELKAILIKSCEDEERKETVSLEKKVYNLMKEIGIPFGNKGYDYVARAIMLCLEKPAIIQAVNKELYPTLAKEYGTTISGVERAIRYAVETVWESGNIEKLHEIFGYAYSPTKGKTTNTEFIAGIAEWIRKS